uniref:Laminin subunit alpha-1-like isoform X1 n=2 Tax=Diabrotica virgifera virgifera TaxID=50390 RepID=A0A6P7G0Y5_DIAVI
MKEELFAIVLFSLFFNCHGYETIKSVSVNPNELFTIFEPIYDKNLSILENSDDLENRYSKKLLKRIARCKRYDQYYQQQPNYRHVFNYQPSYDGNSYQLNPKIIPPRYVIPQPQYYVPTRCNSYCLPCPTSTCGRRCPFIYPTPLPYKTTHTPKMTTRAPHTIPTKPRTSSKTTTRTSSKTTSRFTWRPSSRTTSRFTSKTTPKTTTRTSSKTTSRFTWRPSSRTTSRFTSKTTPKTKSTTRSRPTSKATSRSTARTTWRTTSKTTARTTPKYKGTIRFFSARSKPTTSRNALIVVLKNPCTCDPDGSRFLTCNQTTGACFCKPHYTGTECNSCEDGYWKKNKVCTECKCNVYGTIADTNCDKETGQCLCKPGVMGQQCTSCLPNHYGDIKTSCKRCDPCDKKGHICDPNNGKCICPPLTSGTECEKCVENAWGIEEGVGCKLCNCSITGSSSQQCNTNTGTCSCKIGFEGKKCSSCSFGYYDYPNCKKCNCDPIGTDGEQCKDGLCKCINDGSCKCKQNVQGKYCNECKNNHYGLSKENIKGCTECFCFGRSKTCTDALYHWNKSTRLERTLEEDNQVTEDELSLPKSFLGDITPSYGGYLAVNNSGGRFDVILEGNNVRIRSLGNHNDLQMTESTEFGNWIVSSDNLDFPTECVDKLSRSCFMVIMQNVTLFIIKANNRIKEVLLDKAKNEVSAYPITHSVEKCECPPEYKGLSCEDPNKGYYRYFPKDPTLPWIDRVIGISKKCECRGHSHECNPETGHCKNCTDHTTGEHCETCEGGYYLDPEETCQPCLCPSAQQNNAQSCRPETDGGFVCQCKTGYTGKHCDQCDRKYYSPPNSIECIPCNCNKYGIVPGDLGVCDKDGRCTCQEGFTGDKCNQCVKEREYIEDGVCKSCDECTMKLFDEIDNMKVDIENVYEMFKDGIGPPWRNLTDRLNRHNMLSEKYNKKDVEFKNLLQSNDITKYEVTINELEKKMIKNNEILEDNINNIDKLTDGSTKLLKETGEASKKLISIIDSLDSFGTKQVSLKDALTRARKILKEIQQRSKTIEKLNDKKIFQYCTSINLKVDEIYGKVPKTPPKNIEDLKNKLNALFDQLSYTDNLAKKADNKNTLNAQRLESVKEKFEIMKGKNKQLTNTFNDIVNKLNATEDVLESLETVYTDLINISKFAEYEDLDNRVKRQMEEIPEAQNLYDKAVEHVQELETKVEDYHSMFNFTKDEWKKINASGAYEAIINGIKETRDHLDSAKESLKQAQKLILPEIGDSIVTQSDIAQAYSDRLRQRITNLRDLSKNLHDIKRKIDQLTYGILENGKNNNENSQHIQKTNNFLTQNDNITRMERAIKNASEISETMREIYKKTDDIAFDKQFNFDKKYQKYQDQIDPKEITHLNSDLRTAREALLNLKVPQTSKNEDEKSQDVKDRLIDVDKRLNELQNLISLVKQQVDGVEVPMNLTNCFMSYRVPKRQYFQSLSITFNCNDCWLFRWWNSLTNIEYLSIRVQNNKLIVKVEERDTDIGEISNEENVVNLQKTGSMLKVQMGQNEKGTFLDTAFIYPDHSLEIGSKNQSTEKSAKKPSYIYKVILNGENFGVWNFNKTNGKCIGQRRNVSIDESLNNLYGGKGYFEYGVNNNLDPRKFSIQFKVTTFDENATLYVVADFDRCTYAYIYLQGGEINFFMKFNETESTTLRGEKKINDGLEHSIVLTWVTQAKKYYKITLNDMPFLEPKLVDPANFFRIKKAKHYLGGVPPTFNKTCIPIREPSLLGFLKMETQLSNAGISYGITRTKTLSFNDVWINEQGYLSLNYAKEIVQNISFVLRPIVDTGTIIKFNEAQSISMQDGNILVDGEKIDLKLKQNDYNNIELNLDTDKVIKINGISNTVANPEEITIEKLQIGGLGFVGGIRDIMINNKILSFDNTTVEKFEKVTIGREEPLNELKEPQMRSLSMTNTMQNTERCTEFDNTDIEQDAIKFGDKPNSYTYIKTKFWRTNFTMQFDFRTLYPNGVIFVASNKRKNYILLELKDGQLQLNIEGRKKQLKTLPISSTRINDGHWHHVRLSRKMKKLTIFLDKDTKPSRINIRLKPKDEIYFGGISQNSEYTEIPDLMNRLLPFRGCMRSLEINNEQQFLRNNKNVQSSNITLCFSNVEEGAYFGGDSYAIYKEDFQISDMLELSFEFRTSEQNGILLSVSNQGDYPALSVELQNGGIVMAVNLGNGVITNVTNNLNSDIALCNNKWHNITALYSSSELTVYVDGIRKSWVQSDINSTMDEMEAPLYVGGLPDNAPTGTLKSLTNFKGCIRKLKIENQLMDWSDMKELNNVLLNSCPITENSENSNIP